MAPDCLVCAEIAGAVEVPGGLLWEEEAAVAFHVPPLPSRGDPYLGHLLVVPRRHVAGLGDLSTDEASAIGRGASALSRALMRAADVTWVHAGVAGLGTPHVHLHLLPRYAGTPDDVPWHSVDDWDGARRGGAGELADLAARLKSELASG